jgi:hypothetical protein
LFWFRDARDSSPGREGPLVNRVSTRIALAVALVIGVAAEAKACYPEGDWFHTTASGEVQRLTLANDGTFTFAGTKGSWKATDGRMSGTLAVKGIGDSEVAPSYKFQLAYNGSYENETLTLTGGNLEKPLVFSRTERGATREAPPAAKLSRALQPAPEPITSSRPPVLEGASEVKSTDSRFKLLLPAKWNGTFDGSMLLASTGSKATVRFQFLPIDRADAEGGFEKVAKVVEATLGGQIESKEPKTRATLDASKELVRTLEWSSKRGDETVTVKAFMVQRATHAVVAVVESGDQGVEQAALAALASSSVESSPRETETEKSLVGSWRAGQESYAFAADGTYAWKAPGIDERGRFEVRGGNVYFKSARGEQALSLEHAAGLKLGGISFTK